MTVEQEIINAWNEKYRDYTRQFQHSGQMDIWTEADARTDFLTDLRISHDNWLPQARVIVKNRLAEALVSSSPYVRLLATLIAGQSS